MLDYAIIGKKNEWVHFNGNHDATIAFLQSCSYLPEFITLVLTRSRHLQTSPSLSLLLPPSQLPLLILRLPQSTLVLLSSGSKSQTRLRN